MRQKFLSEVEYKMTSILIVHTEAIFTQLEFIKKLNNYGIKGNNSNLRMIIDQLIENMIIVYIKEKGFILTSRGKRLWKNTKEHYRLLSEFAENYQYSLNKE